MGKRKADEGGGSEEQAAQPQAPVEGTQIPTVAPTVVPQPETPVVVEQLHWRIRRIFELLLMRDRMLDQKEDTSAIDALVKQQTEGFSQTVTEVIEKKHNNVVVIPTLKGARRKTTMDVLDEVRGPLETSGPAQ